MGTPRAFSAWMGMIAGCAAVLAGTLAGEGILRRIPERLFRRVVSGIIGVIGLIMLVRSL